MTNNQHQTYQPSIDEPVGALVMSGDIVEATKSNSNESRPPPKGYLSIVYGVIENSTALWDEQPGPMLEAVNIHDMIIRRNSHEFDGYQTEALGDTFMVVFKTAKSAMQFCLRVQTDLIAAAWPTEILENPYGKPNLDKNYNLIHKGLSVRMGIHWGKPICHLNRVSGLTKYVGPEVHSVTSIVDLAESGQIIATVHFLNELEGAARSARKPMVHPKGLGMGLNGEELEDGIPLMQRVSPHPQPSSSTSSADRQPRQQAFAVKDMGNYELKGLKSALHLYAIAPASLSGRLLRKPKTEEPMTGLQGWWEWAKDGIASNSAQQNVLPV
jgi:adenylate cyclase